MREVIGNLLLLVEFLNLHLIFIIARNIKVFQTNNGVLLA